jgi:glutamate racemase
LQASIRKLVGPDVFIADPAFLTAKHTHIALKEHGLLRGGSPGGTQRYCVTAAPDRFARVSGFFLTTPVAPEEVEVVQIG